MSNAAHLQRLLSVHTTRLRQLLSVHTVPPRAQLVGCAVMSMSNIQRRATNYWASVSDTLFSKGYQIEINSRVPSGDKLLHCGLGSTVTAVPPHGAQYNFRGRPRWRCSSFNQGLVLCSHSYDFSVISIP